ncbi:MAG: nitroreductase family protein [Bacteroidota bacterium]|nr:nitroreductase family protein [Bacteroidota bacterium]
MTEISNPVLECIFSRKSVRHYAQRPVKKDTLELLIKAGMAAPSANNTQPWVFIAITDRPTMTQLGNHLPYAKMLLQAGAAIAVCGNPDLNSKSNPTLWIHDCSAATENILLATESLGLGGVWTACYPYPARYEIVQQILGLPQHIIPLCLISLGYPAGDETPKDKFRPDKIHWEKW